MLVPQWQCFEKCIERECLFRFAVFVATVLLKTPKETTFRSACRRTRGVLRVKTWNNLSTERLQKRKRREEKGAKRGGIDRKSFTGYLIWQCRCHRILETVSALPCVRVQDTHAQVPPITFWRWISFLVHCMKYEINNTKVSRCASLKASRWWTRPDVTEVTEREGERERGGGGT